MTAGENLSADDLRQILAEVERKMPAQQFMVAINLLEDDDLTQKEAPSDTGTLEDGSRSGLIDSTGSRKPFEQVVYDEPHSNRPTQLSDAEHEKFVDALTNHRKKSVSTRPCGPFHSPVNTSPRNSALTTVTDMFAG